RAWLAPVNDHRDDSGATLFARAGAIDAPLADYLRGQNFEAAWEGIRRNAPDPHRRLAQFHRWFDGFRTLKMLHHLRENGSPQQPLFVAVADLLARLQRTAPLAVNSMACNDYAAQRRLLRFLRELDRE